MILSRDPGSEVVTNDNRMHLHQSIKTRFSKEATEFMTRITAFSPENWVSENNEKSESFKEDVRCLADYYNLEASVAVAQYSLFIGQ